ncbi:MAG: magnesium transporter [Candidatus Peregrinibacteria bacterium Greene0416_19]|nr:MAG: magnesium transporter [Candidatus Peregrinibacteria bacterium Greene0416_19]
MDAGLLHRVDEFLRTRSDRALRALLLTQDAREIADVIDALEYGKRKVFALLPPETQADIVMLLSEGSRESVITRLPDDIIARLLYFLDEDDATDILQELPPRRHAHVLQGLKEDRRKRIEKLLTFDPETAGGLMDLHFIEVDPRTSVSAVITHVQEYAKRHKQVPVVFARDAQGIKWISARTLVSSRAQVEAGALSKPIPSLASSTDREHVLDTMNRGVSDVACVVDEHQKVLGVIHLNDLLRVAEAEASEDVYRMGAVGLLDSSYLESRFSTIWRKRVGWLLVLFVAELFTFTALARFEASIAAVTVLALFVPLCISAGGNSGSQAATLITRAMALGHVTPRDWWRVLQRELLMGLALGLALGLVGYVRALLTPQNVLGDADRWMLGLVIGQSVAIICLWGTLVGAMLPLAFRKFGVDPGYASSPFVATFVDVTGIVIYFTIANAVILG